MKYLLMQLLSVATATAVYLGCLDTSCFGDINSLSSPTRELLLEEEDGFLPLCLNS